MKILVVDDEAPQREILGTILAGAGWEVVSASGVKEALDRAEGVDVVLSDLRMIGQGGLELLAALRARSPGTPVVLMTAHGSTETAVRAMKDGAFDYLTKPLGRDELLLTLGRAYERTRLVAQNAALREALDARHTPANVVAEHGAMREVMRLVAKVAPTTSTVLVYGETGTGKEVIARTIHGLSRRKDGPFVAINCAAIPETLLESELFGHEKGAFTGASARKLGHFERAAGGTLFLDEIGDLPLPLQPKLLRVLQERELTRVGGEASLPIDVRVIAATHRDLGKLKGEGTFREDLFWRLNVFPVVLPPLRERATDVGPLVEHFLARLGKDAGGAPPKTVSPEAMRALLAYPWPGNVREVQSVIERASVMADGPQIGLDDLPAEVRQATAKVRLSERLDFEIPESGFVFEELERQILAQAMERSGHVIAKAAKMLGMTYRTLQYRLEKFGLRGDGTPE